MTEFNVFLDIARAVGIPALFAVVFLGLGVKYIPKFLDAWLESRRDLAEQAARSIDAVARCESALNRASEVIAKNCAVNERVIAALEKFAAICER